ncbi:MAG: VWA domain-containing protein, partial [Acidimicrobiia bacterium]|nr:VWA domain-containing protein [Acidimicrobiia bacterium]
MRAPAAPATGRAGRLLAVLGAALALMLLALGVPASADDAAPAPAPVKVTAVDARGPDRVQLSVIGAAVGVTADQVAVRSGDNVLTIDGVTTGSAAGVAREMVVVVDTNARGNDNQVLDTIKAQLLTVAQAPPPGLSMAVVSAGDSALVRTPLTADPAKLTQAVNDLAARNGAALYNGVRRAADLFSDDPGVIRTVVVVSTGSDLGSDVTPKEAQVPLVANGIQVVSVRYDGGDDALG